MANPGLEQQRAPQSQGPEHHRPVNHHGLDRLRVTQYSRAHSLDERLKLLRNGAEILAHGQPNTPLQAQAVSYVCKLLNQANPNCGIDPNNTKFTKELHEAIKEFQRANNLKDDGIVGKDTIRALEAAGSKQSAANQHPSASPAPAGSTPQPGSPPEGVGYDRRQSYGMTPPEPRGPSRDPGQAPYGGYQRASYTSPKSTGYEGAPQGGVGVSPERRQEILQTLEQTTSILQQGMAMRQMYPHASPQQKQQIQQRGQQLNAQLQESITNLKSYSGDINQLVHSGDREVTYRVQQIQLAQNEAKKAKAARRS